MIILFMLPSFNEGDYLLVCNIAYLLSKPRLKDVVIAKHPNNNTLIIKRISKISGRRYYLSGDNEEESSDSKDFGVLGRKEIIGKVFFKISG